MRIDARWVHGLDARRPATNVRDNSHRADFIEYISLRLDAWCPSMAHAPKRRAATGLDLVPRAVYDHNSTGLEVSSSNPRSWSDSDDSDTLLIARRRLG